MMEVELTKGMHCWYVLGQNSVWAAMLISDISFMYSRALSVMRQWRMRLEGCFHASKEAKNWEWKPRKFPRLQTYVMLVTRIG